MKGNRKHNCNNFYSHTFINSEALSHFTLLKMEEKYQIHTYCVNYIYCTLFINSYISNEILTITGHSSGAFIAGHLQTFILLLYQ